MSLHRTDGASLLTSLARERRTLAAAGLDAHILGRPKASRTAAHAATVAGGDLVRTQKALSFPGKVDDHPGLFVTAGGNRVDPGNAAARAGEALGKADAGRIRAETGCASGGVVPVGHLFQFHARVEPRRLAGDCGWASTGTPRPIAAAAPDVLRRVSAQRLWISPPDRFAPQPHDPLS